MIHFCHNRKSKDLIDGTLAIVLPSKQDLEQMFTMHANQIVMIIGLTVKHPHDAFIKKIGREKAIRSMVHAVVELKRITQQGTRHVYHFRTEAIVNRKTYSIGFSLTTVAECDKVNLISALISEGFNENII